MFIERRWLALSGFSSRRNSLPFPLCTKRVKPTRRCGWKICIPNRYMSLRIFHVFSPLMHLFFTTHSPAVPRQAYLIYLYMYIGYYIHAGRVLGYLFSTKMYGLTRGSPARELIDCKDFKKHTTNKKHEHSYSQRVIKERIMQKKNQIAEKFKKNFPILLFVIFLFQQAFIITEYIYIFFNLILLNL